MFVFRKTNPRTHPMFFYSKPTYLWGDQAFELSWVNKLKLVSILKFGPFLGKHIFYKFLLKNAPEEIKTNIAMGFLGILDYSNFKEILPHLKIDKTNEQTFYDFLLSCEKQTRAQQQPSVVQQKLIRARMSTIKDYNETIKNKLNHLQKIWDILFQSGYHPKVTQLREIILLDRDLFIRYLYFSKKKNRLNIVFNDIIFLVATGKIPKETNGSNPKDLIDLWLRMGGDVNYIEPSGKSWGHIVAENFISENQIQILDFLKGLCDHGLKMMGPTEITKSVFSIIQEKTSQKDYKYFPEKTKEFYDFLKSKDEVDVLNRSLSDICKEKKDVKKRRM